MEYEVCIAILLVLVELTWRLIHCDVNFRDRRFYPTIVFSSSALLCSAAVLIQNRHPDLFKVRDIGNAVRLLFGNDCFASLLIGIGLHLNSFVFLVVGSLSLTKFGLLHMFCEVDMTKFTTIGKFGQSTRFFLYLIGPFLFFDYKILPITTLCRLVDVSDRSLLAAKRKISTSTVQRWLWNIGYLRCVALISVLGLCITYSDIERGFGVSAVGHVAHMIIKMVSMFRSGSHFLLNETTDKRRWAQLTDGQRYVELMYQRKYPYLTLELSLLLIASMYFMYLRLTIVPIVDVDTCTFS